MKQEIFTCDRCKKVVPKENDLTEVGAGKREQYYGSSFSGERYEVRQFVSEWCIDCCKEFGLVISNRETPPKPPRTTLEDMIREIVREEMENK